MSTLIDQMLLQFLEDAFVKNLLENQLGLQTLFDLTYKVEDIEVRTIAFAGVQNRQFQMPIFETIYTTGTKEQILPTPERIQINYAQPRYGRLAWIEVFLEILLSTKVQQKSTPIESVTAKSLVEELGEFNSLAELKTKLQSRYSSSIVEAFFKELRISSLEEFQQKGNLFLEFVYKTPPPFDSNDPKNVRNFPVNICVKLQAELNITEALQEAKLCRNILENEKTFRDVFEGGEIKSQYVFVTIFPDSLTTDTQMKGKIKDLFIAENMLAHFLTAT